MFVFKNLYIDVEKKKLIVNGKEIPYQGISDFSLKLNEEGGWQFECKQNVVSELPQQICEREYMTQPVPYVIGPVKKFSLRMSIVALVISIVGLTTQIILAISG